MILEIKAPSPGESVTEVEIGHWLAEDGSLVKKGEEIAEVESDKATLTIVADEAGKLSILVREGNTIAVGSVVATIDTDARPAAGEPIPQPNPEPEPKPELKQEPEPLAGPPTGSLQEPENAASPSLPGSAGLKISAVAREIMKEQQLPVDELIAGLKRIGKREVEEVLRLRQTVSDTVTQPEQFSRKENREKMSPLRRKLSERLVYVKNETAMLTTFNEVDMSTVMGIRNRYQQKFTEKHGLKLGFMSFFARAAAVAIQYHPTVNSMIDGDEIVSPAYVDIGIAVQTPKGLMVPVIRNAESKSVPQLEKEIRDLAEKARTKKISLEELSGGTFTITNGGVFGSLFSTPILNPPQSAILGMHNITERPVAIEGRVEIRPMMYLALSYDHRIIDGKDAVGFLVRVKEMIENPLFLTTLGKDLNELLLDI